MAEELVLFPHCDIHVALNGTPPLRISVQARTLPAAPAPPDHYVLTDVTSSCAFDFFAPHNAVGSRFMQFVTIDATGLVTPTAVGTNLVQIRRGEDYVVARIQVHDRILGWWFGNASITTALDSHFAHAQPSIYALFSEDASGTDLVGDVTGHGYVSLASNDPGIFTVEAHGRLKGVAEGPSSLTGSFLGRSQNLSVRAVDYSKRRNSLDSIRVFDLPGASEQHNILFVGEGFRATTPDRARFDEVVTKVVEDMLSEERHSPFSMLAGAFNVWKAYEPSTQHGLTCSFRVNDEAAEDDVLASGFPIPHSGQISSDGSKYTVELLVRRVGLPRRNETRDAGALIAEWNGQTLFDFDPAKVDADVVKAWKVQRSKGLLEARDTYFGLQLGRRFADRTSNVSFPPIPRPATETAGSDALRAFIRRVYEWFETHPTRTITLDPRRHPPQLLSDWSGRTHDNAILRYFSSLHWRFGSHPNIGAEWVPEVALTPTRFRPSIGLVALIGNDGLIGGTNFGFATANTLNQFTSLSFALPASGTERPMRRTVPDTVDSDTQQIIDTVVHEFGHSFNLGDEYEEFPGDERGFDQRAGEDERFDNVARLAAIFANGTVTAGTVVFADRKIDPDKVKWLDLLRPQLSDRLVAPSREVSGSLEVKIEPRFVGKWVEAKRRGLEAFLRARAIEPDGRQLPLRHDDAHFLTSLLIERVDEATGTIMLGGPELPPSPLPTYPKGSLLYVPLRRDAGELRFLVEKKVREKLDATRLPLNENPDTTQVNSNRDSPVDIADFKPPCKAYKLIGVYEGARLFSASLYRPTGLCKMRQKEDVSGIGDGSFCFVCKYLIVNRVNPGLLDLLDKTEYPGAKKGG